MTVDVKPHLRQAMTVTVTIDVPAVDDWNAVKWPGWMSRDPETGEIEGEPPVTFREDLEQAIRDRLRYGWRAVALDDLFVCAVSARPDGAPYETGRVVDPDNEEPF
jgi:hypothetical protein